MSKRVGVITMHQIHNHGSILQTYATQEAVRRLGYDCQIIDYCYPNAAHRAPLPLRRRAIKQGNRLFSRLIPGNPLGTAERRFRQFADQVLTLSRPYPTSESLHGEPPDYDIYVAGSDQIWNPRFVKGDSSFFLAFAPEGKRRISYASSFGCTSVPEPYAKPYSDYLRRMDHIAVRETAGVELVRTLADREAQLVVDPTLLLSGNEWHAFAQPHGYGDDPYILCYGFYSASDLMERLAMHLRDKTGYRILRVQGKSYQWFSRSMHYVLDAGPAQWLSLFAGAAVVLALSFHGTAYAINMERPFFSVMSGDADRDSRQVDLLGRLGLERHAVGEGMPLPMPEEAEVDYERVRPQLQAYRDSSLDYLRAALA